MARNRLPQFCVLSSLVCLLSLLPGEALPQEASQDFRRGDADGSGVVDITDPILTLQFHFVGGLLPFDCVDAADVDDSGVVDISDDIYSLTYQFIGGIPPPPPPGPWVCGPDPTDDSLGCENYPQERC